MAAEKAIYTGRIIPAVDDPGASKSGDPGVPGIKAAWIAGTGPAVTAVLVSDQSPGDLARDQAGWGNEGIAVASTPLAPAEGGGCDRFARSRGETLTDWPVAAPKGSAHFGSVRI